MMIKIKLFVVIIVTFIFSFNLCASGSITLSKITIDLNDVMSIKRGARVFFDYCQGCHSLKYMRYADLASGININSVSYKSPEELIREYFLHSTDIISENSPILSSISKEYGVKWFGKVPPDLSLVARYRGVDWIYTYMKSFYKDMSRPWGVNNIIFPDVAMPHVLVKLQGVQGLNEHNHNVNKDMLYLIENGVLSHDNYDLLVKDLVAFLLYVSEPSAAAREKIGVFVVGYFVILAVLVYFIKRMYWENIE